MPSVQNDPSGTGAKSVAKRAFRWANRIGGRVDRLAMARADATPAPLFVVGLPRSGTTLVYELIAQAFDVAYLTRAYSYTYGMPNLTTRLIAPWTGSAKPRYESEYGRIDGRFSPAENHVMWMRWFPERPVLGHYVPAGSMQAAAIREANRTLASMTSIAGRQFVFKNVYFTMSINALLATFPEGRVLAVSRDPRAVAASVYKARTRLQRADWWSIRPPFASEVLARDMAWQVAFQCERTRQVLEREIRMAGGDRCLTVDYADVCGSPSGFLDRLSAWLGGTAGRRVDAPIPEEFERRPPQSVDAAVMERVLELCGAMRDDRDAYLGRIDAYLETRDAAASGKA